MCSCEPRLIWWGSAVEEAGLGAWDQGLNPLNHPATPNSDRTRSGRLARSRPPTRRWWPLARQTQQLLGVDPRSAARALPRSSLWPDSVAVWMLAGLPTQNVELPEPARSGPLAATVPRQAALRLEVSRDDAPMNEWWQGPAAPSDDRFESEEAKWLAARGEWLRRWHPRLSGHVASHRRFILRPGSEQGAVVFEELDPQGRVCAARTVGNETMGFGSPRHAVAAATGLPLHDPWVTAVEKAVRRDRSSSSRRDPLLVGLSSREFIHLSATVNRESILRHGLDWSRMAAARGIAGSRRPEIEASFLVWDRQQADFFIQMSRTPVDLWGVRVEGLWIENGPDGWWLVAEPLPPHRLRLLVADMSGGGR